MDSMIIHLPSAISRAAHVAKLCDLLPNAQVVAVDGAKHLWVGEKYVRIVLEEIVERINPAAAPLPSVWTAEQAAVQGAMERWSDL